MNNLRIITSTTRPGRKGIAVAEWFTMLAKETSKSDVQLLDLATVNLPLMDEPNHPRLKQYQHQHTKEWSASIDAADALLLCCQNIILAFLHPSKTHWITFLMNGNTSLLAL